MRKFSKKVSFRITPEEAKAVAALTKCGEFSMSVGALFRKLLAAEAKRKHSV